MLTYAKVRRKKIKNQLKVLKDWYSMELEDLTLCSLRINNVRKTKNTQSLLTLLFPNKNTLFSNRFENPEIWDS